jgi:sugar/nucleoside kinase (ribokinase family)
MYVCMYAYSIPSVRGQLTFHLCAFASQLRSEAHWLLHLPKLPKPFVNPIGAGDAVASGTVIRWAGHCTSPSGGDGDSDGDSDSDGDCDGKVVLEAFRWGVACGAASCLTGANSVFAREDADLIASGIHTQRL